MENFYAQIPAKNPITYNNFYGKLLLFCWTIPCRNNDNSDAVIIEAHTMENAIYCVDYYQLKCETSIVSLCRATFTLFTDDDAYSGSVLTQYADSTLFARIIGCLSWCLGLCNTVYRYSDLYYKSQIPNL